MNMVYLFNFFFRSFIFFISTLEFSITSPVCILLDLYIITLYFLNGCKWYCILKFGVLYSLIVYKIKLIFASLLYIRDLAKFISYTSEWFLETHWKFLHRQSCHLQIGTVFFLPIQSVHLLFLVLLHWVDLLTLC